MCNSIIFKNNVKTSIKKYGLLKMLSFASPMSCNFWQQSLKTHGSQITVTNIIIMRKFAIL